MNVLRVGAGLIVVVAVTALWTTYKSAAKGDGAASFLAKLIGFERLHSASYNSLDSQGEASRVLAVMNGDIPIVYISGRVKENSTPEEVETGHRRSRS